MKTKKELKGEIVKENKWLLINWVAIVFTIVVVILMVRVDHQKKLQTKSEVRLQMIKGFINDGADYSEMTHRIRYSDICHLEFNQIVAITNYIRISDFSYRVDNLTGRLNNSTSKFDNLRDLKKAHCLE